DALPISLCQGDLMSPAETHTPGACTPRAGLYECDCAAGHLWLIDLAGHAFPSFPHGCSAGLWRAKDHGTTAPAGPESDSKR
ncbi:hypothetical protein XF35_42935, partial [Streptomyces platensis subsp. clarensis]|nr:hypothetical protein [Streptomyces platensis subsp. clarensis]